MTTHIPHSQGDPVGASNLAILTAAGSGERLGADVPKALVRVGGDLLVVHAARRLARSGRVDRIVITFPHGWDEEFARCFPHGLVAGEQAHGEPAPEKAASVGPVPIELVLGGATRQASVAAALAQAGDCDVVLVHDAARALATPCLVRRVHDAVHSGHPAVVPGLAVSDTIKQVGPGDASGAPVAATVDRAVLRAVQTPQGFDRTLLERAHRSGAARARKEASAASDDAGLVEALGEPVWVVPGEEEARKITAPADLLVAQAMLSRS